MRPDCFAPIGDQQGAVREFCTAAKALRDASDASKASTRATREQKKRHKADLVEALRRLGDACVEVRMPGGQTEYARLVQRKGAQRRLTAASFADALRHLKSEDIQADCTAAGVTRAAIERMRGDATEDVVVSKRPPPRLQIARMPSMSSTASAYEQARSDLREAGAARKEACAPLKERCEQSREHVLSHLKTHDPVKLQQKVRLTQNAEECTYVLKAKPKPARVGRTDSIREAERTVAAVLGEQLLDPAELLTHLQAERTLSIVDETLRRRLEALKSELLVRMPLEVSFTPAKWSRSSG